VAVILAQKRHRVSAYAADHLLGLTILVDERRDVARAYGVWHRLGLDALNIARPALFVIERTGTIRSIYVAESQGEFPAHDEILAASS
jgi:peroxiredoxin